MKNQKYTIRKIVSFLNNPEENGGFWLPNIQRSFVWSEDQICRLFDSILREYPISTLLVWTTTSSIKRRKFIDNWKETLRLSDFVVPLDSKKKCLVLDGQQRLQSLFIGLHGSYEGKELYLDILGGEVAPPDDVKYKFRFLEPTSAKFPWISLKRLVITQKRKRELLTQIESSAGRSIDAKEEDKIEEHLDLVDRTFKTEEVVTYQELDSIDNPLLYTEDDVVEVFIRANSGGTKLGKSDLLFSLLTASWDDADGKMEELFESLNKFGFEFTRDFVLKTCLVLLDQGARYEVEKFRKDDVRSKIEKEWGSISGAIQDVFDYIREKTYIHCGKALPTYLVLIPLVYVRHHFPAAWDNSTGMDRYVLHAALTGAFGGNVDSLLDALVSKLRELGRFDLEEAFDVIRGQGRSLELTEGKLWEMGYGSDTIHLLFNIWYRDFNHTPAYESNLPQIDHVFPQSALRKVKTENPITKRRDVLKYRDRDRNQLANCMLLSLEENGASGKSDVLPETWFADKSNDYLEKHLIPKDKSVWKLDRFEDFVEARKQLIRDKFAKLLSRAGP